MSIGTQAKEAKPSGGGNLVRDGLYKFVIEKIELIKGYKGIQSYVCELRVLESAEQTGLLDDKDQPIRVTPNAVGTSCTYLTKDEFDTFAGNVHAFSLGLYGGLGYPPEAVTAQMIDNTYHPANPFRGVIIADETYRSTNKGRRNIANLGKKLTLHKWVPVPGQTKETIAKMRAYLDSTAARAEAASTPVAPAAPVQPEPVAPVQPEPVAPAAQTAAMDPALAALLGM